MTVFLTVVSGVIVGVFIFVFSECLKEIWLTPLQEYKKIKSRVSYTLTFYASIYSNPLPSSQTVNKIPDNYEQASIELRKLASELRAFIETLSFFKPLIPKRKILFKTSADLIGLSNNLSAPKDSIYKHIEFNTKRESNICENLKIYKEKTK
jgi:hypothetical protein